MRNRTSDKDKESIDFSRQVSSDLVEDELEMRDAEGFVKQDE